MKVNTHPLTRARAQEIQKSGVDWHCSGQLMYEFAGDLEDKLEVALREIEKVKNERNRAALQVRQELLPKLAVAHTQMVVLKKYVRHISPCMAGINREDYCLCGLDTARTDVPSQAQALLTARKTFLAAAGAFLDDDPENQVPSCRCCGMELDLNGEGHRSGCLVDLILEHYKA